MPSMPVRRWTVSASAFEATRRGGSTVTTSLTHPRRNSAFPVARIVAEARTIKGSYIGTCVPGRDIPAFIQLYRQGRMPVDKLVTRTLKLDEINEAFDALSEAKGGAAGHRFLVVCLGLRSGMWLKAMRIGAACSARCAPPKYRVFLP
jgi:threonine dehydrogenase-like Zn-dependent dehydrogenase